MKDCRGITVVPIEKPLISFIAISLILFLTGCSSGKGTFEGEVYVNKTIGIRMVPPEAWKLKELHDQSTYQVRFMAPEVYGGILIGRNKLPFEQTETTFQEFVETFRKSLLAPGMKIKNERESVYKGTKAHFIDYSYNSMPPRDGRMIITIRKDGYGYLVQYFCVINTRYRHNLALVEKSLQTLTFDR